MADSTSGPPKPSNPQSDTEAEGGEKPVREQLKKTSIDAAKVELPADLVDNEVATAQASSAPRRKRSRDEDDGDTAVDAENGVGRHVRKRSRDNDAASPVPEPAESDRSAETGSKGNSSVSDRSVTPPPSKLEASAAIQEAIVSPKGKRTRAQYQKDDDHHNPPLETEAKEDDKITPNTTIETTAQDDTDGRGAKRHRDIGEKSDTGVEVSQPKVSSTKLGNSSGFSDASATSPFASLNTSSASAQDKPSAFASKTQDGKTGSPFGTLGQSSAAASPFAALSGQSKAFGAGTKTESAFGGSLTTQSGFGAVASKPGISAFGSLNPSSSPFASALGGKSAFSSFAPASSVGGKPPPILGLSSKPAKPFGAPQSDSEGEESDDDADATDVSKDIEQGISSPNHEGRRDRRFVEQEVETGEENERTLFSSRAKLYYFDGAEKSWKERGVGTFKFNITRPHDSSYTDEDETEVPAAERKARFIMRAEGSHRLLLNSPLSRQTKFGDANGQCPKANTILWYGVLDGHDKPLGLQLKMKADLITSLWEVVNDAKDHLT